MVGREVAFETIGGNDMTSYVGLDVSLKSTSICVVNADGEVTSEHTVDSDPDTIAHFVYANASGVKRIGLESGPTSAWLWRELAKRSLPVVCIDARHAKAALSMQINKSDRNDAVGIASLGNDLISLRCRETQRLLGDHVDPGVESVQNWLGVDVVWCRDEQHIRFVRQDDVSPNIVAVTVRLVSCDVK